MPDLMPYAGAFQATGAVVAALIAAAAALLAANQKSKLEKELAQQKGDLEEKLNDAKIASEKAVSEARAKSEEHIRQQMAKVESTLIDLRANHDRELAKLEAALKAEAASRETMLKLNEHNWDRVLRGLVALRSAGFEMTGAFRSLLRETRTNLEMSDNALANRCLTVLRAHEAFSSASGSMRGDIRHKDFDALTTFLSDSVLIFIDVGRTTDERRLKRDRMEEHEQYIVDFEIWFEEMLARVLRPVGPLPREG